MSKKLQKPIENKLEKLSKLLDNIAEAQIIVAHEPETWDSDTLYSLVEDLKEALKLLEDQLIEGKADEFGQLVYEEGLCSLVDSYQSEEEEEYD